MYIDASHISSYTKRVKAKERVYKDDQKPWQIRSKTPKSEKSVTNLFLTPTKILVKQPTDLK